MTPCELKKEVAIGMGVDENHVITYSYKDNKIIEREMPKFDVVVGNPPYKQGLHLKFLKLAMKIGDVILFIQPVSFLLNEKPVTPQNNKKERYELEKEIKDLINIYGINVELHNAGYLFPDVGISSYLGILYMNKFIKNKICINDKTKDIVTEYNICSEISKYGNSLIYKNLKNKILSFSNLDNLYLHRQKDKGNYYVNLSEIRGHVSKLKNQLFLNDFYTFIPKDRISSDKITHTIFFGFQHKKDADNCIDYLKTNFARFCLSIYKLNTQQDLGELAIVPWLDFTQEWTDEKLYKHFDLTQEEIQFIETNIPKYY
jgi:hypothetical protein